jgi:hypothetical protein
VIPNFGFWKDYPNLIKSWLRHVDGGMNEMFVKVGSTRDGYDSTDMWETQLQSIKDAQTLGKTFLGISHSPNDDRAAARYGYATMLLGGDGDAHFAMHGDYANENWFPEYDYAIGSAVTADTREAYGIHRRKFTNGLVLVNPTGYPVRVAFGGTYSGSGLSNASETTMAPRTALVLTRAGQGGEHVGGQAGQAPAGGAGVGPGLTRTVKAKVRCRVRRGCRGMVKLKRGRTVVAKRKVRIRGRRTVKLRFVLASAARHTNARYTVARLRGARITLS